MKPTPTLLDNLSLAHRFGPDASPREWTSRAEWKEMENAVKAGLVRKVRCCGTTYAYKTTHAGLEFLKKHAKEKSNGRE